MHAPYPKVRKTFLLMQLPIRMVAVIQGVAVMAVPSRAYCWTGVVNARQRIHHGKISNCSESGSNTWEAELGWVT